MITTSFGSYLFRTVGIYPRGKKDTTGTTERMVTFIFILSGNYLLGLLSAALGAGYKVIFEKRKDKEVLISPIYGVVLSFIWLFIM